MHINIESSERKSDIVKHLKPITPVPTHFNSRKRKNARFSNLQTRLRHGGDARQHLERNTFAQNLLDLDKLKVKDQGRVLGNARDALVAIGKLCWHCDATLSTNLHALNTNVPTADDVAGAELERERLALLVRWTWLALDLTNRFWTETYNQRPCHPRACRCNAYRQCCPSLLQDPFRQNDRQLSRPEQCERRQ